MSQGRSLYSSRWDYSKEIYQQTTVTVNQTSVWVPPSFNGTCSQNFMKRSVASTDNVPQCALNPPETTNTGNSISLNKGNSIGKAFPHFSANRGSGVHHQNAQRHLKPETQYPPVQEWSNTFENSNPSWESDWPTTSNTSLNKSNTLSSASYKQRNTASSYQSSSNDWSTGDSSSSSVPSGYAAMHAPQQSSSNSLSASSSSYYEHNNFYGGSYNYDSSGFTPPSYRGSSQQYHQSMRPCDPVTGSYNGNRNPSSCPPNQVKQPIPDYQQRNFRYGMDNMFNKVQIKREPDDYNETEGDNFTSLFTKSLTSLYSEDPDNAFREDGKAYEPDIMVCSPPPPPLVSNMDEQQTNYQRLGSSTGHYNNSTNYQNTRNNSFGFYENRNQTVEPTPNVVELGSENGRSNSFRYDRPSFDDMHLYASSPNDTKTQMKKRKLSMPIIPPEGNFGAEHRKKVPRLMSFKSDSKWTPNSFAFSDIQIKQEPEDDYPSSEKDSQNSGRMSLKDNFSHTNGNGNSKSPQTADHPKPAPRKRSPAATCFDRFEKKSTPTNKKVSPLSVYAKVQDSIVLNVKCRRYKKRTKPIINKEEVVYPGREEIENWKRTGAYSQTPDHAVRILMGELLDRTSQIDGKEETDGPDLTQLDPLKVRELLFQFCQRYSIDFRDFEDINSVLKSRIIEENVAKNSERASAIRKRTSISPVQQESEPELAKKTPKVERVIKKASNEDLKPAVRRVLRNLPGREQLPELVEDEIRPSRRRSNKTPVVRRRYSTRSANVDDKNSSDVDIIIDSSTDRESEAGKEAEVRKKSERLKNKQIVEMPAKDTSSDRKGQNKKEEPRTRSREKSKEDEKAKDSNKANSKRKWSRCHSNSTGFLRSSSIEIVDITRSDTSSPSDSSKDVNDLDFLPAKKPNKKVTRNSKSISESSLKKVFPKIEDIVKPSVSSRKKQTKYQEKKSTDNTDNQMQSDKKDTKLSKEVKKSDTLRNSDSNPKHKKVFPFSKEKDNKKDSLVQGTVDTDNSKLKKGSHTSNDKKNGSLMEPATSSNCRKSKVNKDNNKNRGNLSTNKFDTKPDRDLKILNRNIKIEAENEKSSALLRNSKTSAKSLQKMSDKHSSQMRDKKNLPSNDSLKLKKKTIKDDKFLQNQSLKLKQLEHSSHMETKDTSIILNKSQSVECPPKLEREGTKEMDNVEVRNKVAKNSVQLSNKELQRRRSSQHSDSELQVVLTKLPDVHINATMSSIPLEVFERCVPKERIKNSVLEDMKPKSEDNSSVGSPPELVRINEIKSVQSDDMEISDEDSVLKSNSHHKDGPPTPLSLIDCDTAVISNVEDAISIKKEPKPITALRYSADSEDSECALVIDLDRRLSTEEQTSSFEVNFSDSEEKDEQEPDNKIEEQESDIRVKEQQKPDNISELSLSKEPSFKICEETIIASVVANITLQVAMKYDSLQNKSGEHLKTIKDSATMSSMVALRAGPLETLSSESSSMGKSSNEKTNTKDHSRAESILRSLLLETSGDSSTAPPRPSISSTLSEDSKARITENVRQFLLTQVNDGAFLASLSPGDSETAYEDMKLALDQLPDINANLLADTEECVHDPKMFKERVERLKHEIMYLQCVAYQKEKERIGMICLKRYMEEVMKRLIKKYNLEQRKQDNCKDGECLLELVEPSCSFLPESCCSYPPVSTSTATTLTEGTHLQSSSGHQIIKMSSIALSIAKTEGPSSSVTNDESSSTLCGEKLPTVEAMIAKATENYGVDMRTVERCSTTTKQTILQKVLSSKESIFSQTSNGSSIELRNSEQTSTHHQESVKIFQKKIPSGSESPFKPFRSASSSSDQPSNEEPIHQNLLHKALSKEVSCSPSSSQSPPSLVPEVKNNVASSFSSPSTSFQNQYPLDFSNGKSGVPCKLDIPPVPIKSSTKKSNINSKSSLQCSPGTSYSIWSKKLQATKTVSSEKATDLRINNVKAQETKAIETAAPIPSCSSGPSFVRPPSAKSQIFSPKPVISTEAPQRPENANLGESILKSNCEKNYGNRGEKIPKNKSEKNYGNVGESTLQNNTEKNYSQKTEEELRALPYPSLVASSNSLSYGVHARNMTPLFTLTKPPGTTTPNGSPYKCMGCGISDAKFLCSGCRNHWYCSAQCQNLRWPEHSQSCAGNMYSSDAGPSYPKI